jgi:hypothetical protein
MPSSVATFQSAYLNANGGQRAQLIQTVTQLNANETQIGNLLVNLNLNDVSKANRMRPDNIYFVCAQLLAFPTFKF